MKLINYIKENWLLFAVGCFAVGSFLYLTYGGNQFCDCAKTETYRDGTTGRRHTSGVGFYRYYHK